jgi:hypothetical protein
LQTKSNRRKRWLSYLVNGYLFEHYRTSSKIKKYFLEIKIKPFMGHVSVTFWQLCGVHTVPITAPVWDQTALRHEKQKSRITILNDLECPIIVWKQSYMFVKESYGSGLVRRGRPSTPARNNRETQLALSSRITIVTLSWQILLYWIKIVTMSCVVWSVSCGTGMIWRNFALSFLADWVQIASRSCRMRTVFAESVPEEFSN